MFRSLLIANQTESKAMTDPIHEFNQEISDRVSKYPDNKDLQKAKVDFFHAIGVNRGNYVYNFSWLGVPIIQLPQDLIAFQEIIWRTKPDLIIETGIAWGGTLMFSASMLAMLEVCGVIEKGQVIGIDIDIRPHNKKRIAEHPLSRYLTTFEGSSIEASIVDQVKEIAASHQRVMVCLDSNHTHDHVLEELRAYAPLVTCGNYCIVGDTIIEDSPDDMSSHRPWGKGNNPKSALWAYLDEINTNALKAADGHPLKFEMDRETEHKIVLTGSPDGYLRRVGTLSSEEDR
jgi:cephalosporin hydroxylase